MSSPNRAPKQLSRIVAAFVFALLPSLSGCARARQTPRSDMVVMVYNIHAGKDAKGADNLERVSDLIRSTRSDIVLLQEVDRRTRRSNGVDQPAELARLTGMHVAFGKSLDYQGGEYGIAVMSRWPITSDTMLPLPVVPAQERAGGSREPRGAIHAVIATPLGPVSVVNTHIDASRDDRWRRQEISTVIAIASAARRTTRRVLIGGDLNSTPESAVQDSVRAAAFRDAWTTCGRGDGMTFPADSAIKRIDYLYLSPGMTCTEASVLRTNASDHLPVVIRLRLNAS